MVLYIVVLGGIWSIFDPICFPFVFVSLSCIDLPLFLGNV